MHILCKHKKAGSKKKPGRAGFLDLTYRVLRRVQGVVFLLEFTHNELAFELHGGG